MPLGAGQLLGDWMRESWAWEGVGRVCAKRGSCAAFMACCRDLAFFAFMHMFLLLCCLLYWVFFIILRAWGAGGCAFLEMCICFSSGIGGRGSGVRG